MSFRLPSPRFFLLVLFLYCFQVFFGLCEAVWWDRDEIQTYLIGLKYYTTQTWPYFGPDVNGVENQSFQSQIPGALEGLLIGLPFYLCPIPEAPYLLLGLLTTLGAYLLSWYIHRRLPVFSHAWLMVWICVTPWVLQECCHVINPAYDFLPSVLFFIGFFESLPDLRLNIFDTPNNNSPPRRQDAKKGKNKDSDLGHSGENRFSKSLAPWPSTLRLRAEVFGGEKQVFLSNAAMGFGIFWIMQFHFSYVFLLPLAAYALFAQAGEGRLGKAVLGFLCGAAPMAAFILPTWITYGLSRSNVASGFAVPFFFKNVTYAHLILARYLSMVCFEVPRFLAEHTNQRITSLLSHPWLLVPGVIFWLGGWIQAILLLLAFFNRHHPEPHWPQIRNWTVGCLLFVYVSFWFTTKSPNTHIYLVFYPLVMLYSCYVWSLFSKIPGIGLWVKILLVMGLYYQAGLVMTKWPINSMYAGGRTQVVKALEQKDYRIFHDRRPGVFY